VSELKKYFVQLALVLSNFLTETLIEVLFVPTKANRTNHNTAN